MKRILCATLMMMSVPSVYAQLDVTPAPVKHLYVPTGFDSNDSVEVVVTGNFPNPCYSRNTVSVEVKNENINVEISALRRDDKLRCPDVAVPFKEVVSIGNLQGGDYKINVNGTLSEALTISEATSGAVDDHLYAAIDQLEHKGGDNYILHGWRYSPCIDLDRVEVVSNGKDTLSVLPIMKQNSDFCPMKLTPVSYPVNLAVRGLKIQEPLVHIRTMDGKSFNTVLDLRERR